MEILFFIVPKTPPIALILGAIIGLSPIFYVIWIFEKREKPKFTIEPEKDYRKVIEEAAENCHD